MLNDTAAGARFTGPTAEAAVAAARKALGESVPLSEPVSVLTGGMGGFFARRVFEVRALPNPSAGPDGAADEVEDDVAELFAADTTVTDAVRTYSPALVGQAAPAAPLSPFAQALHDMTSDPTVTYAVTHTSGTMPNPDPASPFTFPGAALTVADALPAPLAAALCGVAPELLGTSFATAVATDGPVRALTGLFTDRYRSPGVPVLDTGEVLAVVGIGPGVVAAARTVAEAVGANPAHVFAAGSSAAVALVPGNRRVRTAAAASALVAKEHTAPLVVAVDTGWGEPSDTVTGVLAALNPFAVWAVVDGTRRDDDVMLWLAGQAQVDALIVENVEHTTATTATLGLGVPVVFVDGHPATPKRWAALVATAAAR